MKFVPGAGGGGKRGSAKHEAVKLAASKNSEKPAGAREQPTPRIGKGVHVPAAQFPEVHHVNDSGVAAPVASTPQVKKKLTVPVAVP